MSAEFRSGWHPEPDEVAARHWSYSLLRGASAPPGSSDLRPYSASRHNQQNTSSCVAQAVVKALEIRRAIIMGPGHHIDLSRLAVYYLARELCGSQLQRDDGTYIYAACDAVRRFGVCPEADWPWNQDNVSVPPPWRAMRRAYQHKIQAYYRIDTTGTARIEDVQRALAGGKPVVWGTAIGSNWKSYAGGDEVIGKPDEVIGRHATVLIGWDDERDVFIGENSWGHGWGNDGFYYVSPAVVAAYESRDFTVMVGSVV